ncbi:hypothetical protein PORCRE_2034 [Porphyromonas crevioricanis JCM 15906]|uniref:Uncharacterized protein n=1 Tax=Porphyromonas crevioricanis JCM 15906 TaxID=1305617 RepID=T1CSX9_9PORP|nr:hypothetical protein PORCRE_2034 [Porphyromonas crevioricanis JCM 15906]GAD06722.1 hypothetical protein PORCAN_323 [Porphyromonas crevioricanis JCM 13913]
MLFLLQGNKYQISSFYTIVSFENPCTFALCFREVLLELRVRT